MKVIFMTKIRISSMYLGVWAQQSPVESLFVVLIVIFVKLLTVNPSCPFNLHVLCLVQNLIPTAVHLRSRENVGGENGP